jgi:hypothetical protein
LLYKKSGHQAKSACHFLVRIYEDHEELLESWYVCITSGQWIPKFPCPPLAEISRNSKRFHLFFTLINFNKVEFWNNSFIKYFWNLLIVFNQCIVSTLSGDCLQFPMLSFSFYFKIRILVWKLEISILTT